MKLPCQHISAAREMSDIDLFDESLCDMRRTASYYHRRQRIFFKQVRSWTIKAPQLVVTTKPKEILNQNERFWEVNKICVNRGIHYQRRNELLHNFAYMWITNIEVLHWSIAMK